MFLCPFGDFTFWSGPQRYRGSAATAPKHKGLFHAVWRKYTLGLLSGLELHVWIWRYLWTEACVTRDVLNWDSLTQGFALINWPKNKWPEVFSPAPPHWSSIIEMFSFCYFSVCGDIIDMSTVNHKNWLSFWMYRLKFLCELGYISHILDSCYICVIIVKYLSMSHV